MVLLLMVALGILSLPLAAFSSLLSSPCWQWLLLPLLCLGGCVEKTVHDGPSGSSGMWAAGADTIHARLEGLEMDDDIYARLDRGGSIVAYRLAPRDGLDLFLAVNVGGSAVLKLEQARLFIPDSGETENVTRIASAYAGGESFERWLEDETSDMIPVDSLYSLYDQQYLEALGRR